MKVCYSFPVFKRKVFPFKRKQANCQLNCAQSQQISLKTLSQPHDRTIFVLNAQHFQNSRKKPHAVTSNDNSLFKYLNLIKQPNTGWNLNGKTDMSTVLGDNDI